MTIALSQVTKKYGKEFALKEVEFHLEKGKIYGLVGPNGSGKSTALKMMTGLVFPDSGEVTLNGTNVTRKTTADVAYLTELDMFYESFTVQETVDFVASQFTNFNKNKAMELMSQLKLDPKKKVKSLSKGNRGRLKLVTALARDAEVILLDEPFSGLDPMVREATVKSLLQYVQLDKQILVIATHEINEIEPLLDQVIALYYGDIIGKEDVEVLREEHGTSVLEWFKNIVHQKEEGAL